MGLVDDSDKIKSESHEMTVGYPEDDDCDRHVEPLQVPSPVLFPFAVECFAHRL